MQERHPYHLCLCLHWSPSQARQRSLTPRCSWLMFSNDDRSFQGSRNLQKKRYRFNGRKSEKMKDLMVSNLVNKTIKIHIICKVGHCTVCRASVVFSAYCLTAVRERKKEHGQSSVLADLSIRFWVGSVYIHKTWLQTVLSLFNHMSCFC